MDKNNLNTLYDSFLSCIQNENGNFSLDSCIENKKDLVDIKNTLLNILNTNKDISDIQKDNIYTKINCLDKVNKIDEMQKTSMMNFLQKNFSEKPDISKLQSINNELTKIVDSVCPIIGGFRRNSKRKQTTRKQKKNKKNKRNRSKRYKNKSKKMGGYGNGDKRAVEIADRLKNQHRMDTDEIVAIVVVYGIIIVLANLFLQLVI